MLMVDSEEGNQSTCSVVLWKIAQSSACEPMWGVNTFKCSHIDPQKMITLYFTSRSMLALDINNWIVSEKWILGVMSSRQWSFDRY